LEAAIAAPS